MTRRYSKAVFLLLFALLAALDSAGQTRTRSVASLDWDGALIEVRAALDGDEPSVRVNAFAQTSVDRVFLWRPPHVVEDWGSAAISLMSREVRVEKGEEVADHVSLGFASLHRNDTPAGTTYALLFTDEHRVHRVHVRLTEDQAAKFVGHLRDAAKVAREMAGIPNPAEAARLGDSKADVIERLGEPDEINLGRAGSERVEILYYRKLHYRVVISGAGAVIESGYTSD